MSVFQEWAFAVCLAAVTGGICHILLPNSSLERIFKVTASAFFICCLIYPLLDVGRLLRMEVAQSASSQTQEVAANLEETMEEQIDQSAQTVFYELASKKLDEMGIKDPVIHIYIRTEAESISAEDVMVEVLVDRECEPYHEEIIRILQVELGVEVRIGYKR